MNLSELVSDISLVDLNIEVFTEPEVTNILRDETDTIFLVLSHAIDDVRDQIREAVGSHEQKTVDWTCETLVWRLLRELSSWQDAGAGSFMKHMQERKFWKEMQRKDDEQGLQGEESI